MKYTALIFFHPLFTQNVGGISSHLLKKCTEMLKKPFEMFKNSPEEGLLPGEWKRRNGVRSYVKGNNSAMQ